MTGDRNVRTVLIATAALAVAILAGLGWFNWWLRHAWTRIYPICHYHQTVQLIEPMTAEATDLFLHYMASRESPYIHIQQEAVYAKSWFWLFGGPEIVNVTNAVLSDLARAHNRDPDGSYFCQDFGVMGTLRGERTPLAEDYPSTWGSDILHALAFGVDEERVGRYTLVGHFFQLFDDQPPAPPLSPSRIHD